MGHIRGVPFRNVLKWSTYRTDLYKQRQSKAAALTASVPFGSLPIGSVPFGSVFFSGVPFGGVGSARFEPRSVVRPSSRSHPKPLVKSHAWIA